MKRELKVYVRGADENCRALNCKAHPDEKGTERSSVSAHERPSNSNCKAYPDEKGTEG